MGELFLPVVRQKVMVADTIGFIQDLPPSLIQAFKTTLAEIVDADLILHVIDVGDSNIKLKIKVVNEILNELLDGKQTKQIYVFNKSDLLENKGWSEEAKLEYIADLTEEFIDYQPQIVSALDKDSLPRLIECIENNLSLVAKS